MFTDSELKDTNIIYMLGNLQAKIDEFYNSSKEKECKMEKLLVLDSHYKNLINSFNEIRRDIESEHERVDGLEKKIFAIYQVASYTAAVLGVGASVIGTIQIFFSIIK